MVEKEVVHIEVGQVVFRKYQVLELLGRGGMGEVWLVKDLDLDDIRALKVINKGLAFDSGARARLRQEAQAMVKIKHPNFATLYELRLDLHDIAYFVMEYIPGKSLEKVLTGQPMPLEWVDDVVNQLCEALQEAHSLGIIHRDLKPSNLIITTTRSGREVLKVLDFGIAKIPSSGDRPNELMTMDNAFMGTPPYASPEQACGRAVPLSDIYSVGVILYEFLTGRRPFRGHPNLVITDTISTPPPSFAEVNPDANVPVEIEKFVLRCLAKKPEDRPQSPHALLSEFREALAKSRPVVEIPVGQPEPPQTKPKPPGPRPDPSPTPFSKRNRQIFFVVGAGIVILTVGIASFSRRKDTRGSDSTIYQDSFDKSGQIAKTHVDNIIPPPLLPQIRNWHGSGRDFFLREGKYYLPDKYKSLEASNSKSEGFPRKIIRDDGVVFIWIPGRNDFEMGARGKPNDDPTDCDETNTLTRPHIKMPGFYIQEREVTNQELDAYELEDATNYRDDAWRIHYNDVSRKLTTASAMKHAARGVSWRLAAAFAKHHGGWLPTEAQWEFAARSGGLNRAVVWDEEKLNKEGGIKIADLANLDYTVPIDHVFTKLWDGKSPKYDMTEQGVIDMAGNVREWCRDIYVEYDKMLNEDPRMFPDDPEPTFDDQRLVVRGGCFWDSFRGRSNPGCYITRRYSDPITLQVGSDQYIGFRMVIECPRLDEGH